MLSKLLIRTRFCEDRIRRIALNFGLSPSAAAKIQFITDIPSSLLVKVVKYIMATECTSLIRDEGDMKILMYPALRLYMALGPKVIDLTAFLSFCPIRLKYQYLKSAVIRISQFTPNIEELLVSSKTPRYYRKFDSIVDAEMLKALYRLTNLRVLQLDEWCCFEITDVFQLCENLPGLQILSINFPDSFDDYYDFDDQVECAAVLKRSMSNLKEFIYTARNNDTLRTECMRNLSNLHVFHEYSDLFRPKEDYDPSAPNEVVPGYSNLQHLYIDFDVDVKREDMHLKNPHIRHIMMLWYGNPDWVWDTSWKKVLNFSNIESLTFLGFPPDVLFHFIDTYGAKLNALNIHHENRAMEPFLNLNRMLTACPLLERLRLSLVINDPEPITFYARLKEVELNFAFPDGSRDEMVNILSAPDLEKVILSNPCLEDLIKLTSKVAKNEILQKHIHNCILFLLLRKRVIFRDMEGKCGSSSKPDPKDKFYNKNQGDAKSASTLKKRKIGKRRMLRQKQQAQEQIKIAKKTKKNLRRGMNEQDLVKLTSMLSKLLIRTRFCEDRIRRIALNFGLSPSAAAKIQFITDIPSSLLVKVVKYIMATECTSLIRDEGDMKILMYPALRLYMALGPKVIDLTAFLSFCPIRLKYQYLKSAVIRISQFTPNIEELLVSSKTPRYYRKFDSIVDAEMLKALYRLTNLRVLQLDEWCCFEITDVFKLCENLPGLQILSINFPDSFDDYNDFDDDRVECAAVLKRCMSNLKEFIYTTRENTTLRTECMRNLSNLHVIKEYSDLFHPKEDYDPSAPNEVVPGYSNLQHFYIHFDMNIIKEDIHLKNPHTRHIMMLWFHNPEFVWDYWENVLNFSNIESLTFLGFPPDVLFRFIDTFGAKLNALNIHHENRAMEPFLNLNRMLTACPLLERLRLSLVINDPEPITFYARLKEVELNFAFPDGSRDEMVNILSAPDLEKVILSNPCLEDLIKLTSKVAKKEILQKVKTLVIDLEVDSFALFANVDQFKGIVEFIKCAAACLNNLTNLKFYLNERRSEYSTLAKSLRNERTINEEYPDVTAFFFGANINNESTSCDFSLANKLSIFVCTAELRFDSLSFSRFLKYLQHFVNKKLCAAYLPYT
ncbi:Hypothetical predicted protein [Cloeon dipterum]|uniref:F-box domain-containing protein n=1 Tax=Cloeon dipterum TaxID=197152 RepID=A0A8S1D9B3_9INSE|nr:Hypothetical predicted protein [Cloeon dipterum]